MATSGPKYTVESKTEEYDIRLYSRMTVAETSVDSSFEEAGRKAFRTLADYIFGKNKSDTKIAMTSPVTVTPQPSSQQKHLVRFTMPNEFELSTLPDPIDPNVSLVEIPIRRIAVYSYSGAWSEKIFKENLEILTKALARDNLKPIGEPTSAKYDSPFQLEALRRNEIWQEISK